MKTRPNRRGFSLAELLIAVIVLGLLATLAFMSFRLIVQKSTDQKQATTMRSLLKETQILYLQNQSTVGYSWEDALTQAAADLPVYVAYSEGTLAIDQTIQGYRFRTDGGNDDYSLATNDILTKTSGTSLYVGVYLNSSKATFGTVSTVGAPLVWQAACQGSGCDAENAVTGPPAGGNYGGTLPQATGAPTLSTAIAQDSSSVTLTWVSSGANVTDYTVQYRTSPSGTWMTFTHAASSALTQTVTGLTAGTEYDFQVSSVNPGGSSVFSTSISTSTIATAPAIASTTPLGGAVSLTITPPTISASVIDYTVQYRTSPSGAWTTFAHAASTSTSVTVTGLAGSTTYDFRVAAVNSGGTSAYSATSTQTTLASPPVITANVVDSTCGTPACIALTWSAPASYSGTLTDYTVQYRTSPSGTWTTFAHAASTSTSITVTGLAYSTAYDFQLSAVTSAGSTPYSVAATKTTLTAAPTSLAGTSSSSSLALTWTAPAQTAAITNYTVQYRTSPSGAWTTFSHTASTTASITVTGLTVATTYDFRVAATSAAGDSAYSASLTQATLSAPPVISANVVDSTCGTPACVALTWSAPASYTGTLTDYVIQYRTSPSGTWTSFAHTASTATSITVTGLAYSTAYNFQIAAVTSAGNTPYSTAGTVTTLTAAPTSLAGTSVSNSVSLTWTAPAQTASVTDYKIQYTLQGGSVWTTFAHTSSTTASITVTGLTGASYYNFRVAATSAAGDSAYTSTATAQAGAAPSYPTIGSYSRGFTVSGALSWIDLSIAPGSSNGLAITAYSAECTSSTGGTASASGAPGIIRVSGLTQRALYYCYARTTNAAGQSQQSGPSTQFMAWGVPNAPATVNIFETSSQSQTLSVNITGAGSGGQWLTYFYVGCTSNNGGPAIDYAWSTNSGTLNGGQNPDGAYINLSYSWPTNYAGKQYTCTASATNPAGTSAGTASNSVTLYGYPTPYPGQYGTQYGSQYGGVYGSQYGWQYPGEYPGQYPGQYGGPSTR